MSAEYHELADTYQKFSESGLAAGYRNDVEQYSVLDAIGPVENLSVLDVGCGYGRYAVLLAKRGAAQVMGVDISPQMIEQATLAAQAAGLDVTFSRHDVREMPTINAFDLSIAIYLLQYAKNIDELAVMYRNIAANLRPGGRFVALTVDSSFRHGEKNTEKYGFSVAPAVDPQNGDELRFTMYGTPPQTVSCYHWERAAHERVASQAGLRAMHWQPLRADPARGGSKDTYGDLLENPPFVLLSAERC